MTNLVQSLFRIDPTEGLVQYANAVKPYHSKILDVLVEYIYSEKVAVSMKERWSWKMTFERPKVDTVYTCGYGLVWDPYKLTEAAPSVNVISAQTTISLPLVVRAYADDTRLSISTAGYTLTDGMQVTVHSTGTLPASIPQVRVGVPYTVSGHNSNFTLIDPLTHNPIQFLTNGTGTISIEPSSVKFNSFLVDPVYGPDFSIAVINTKANQFAFVNTYSVSSVNSALKQWTIDSDIRPVIPVANVVYDDTSLPVPAVANNCCFVFSGNHEGIFPPSSTFTITSGTNAGSYVVADSPSGRSLTRYDGKQTIVPVNTIIPTTSTAGSARTGLSTILPVGSNIFINNNTGIGGNGRYTVSQVATVGSSTVITVEETVSMLAANNGAINVIVQPSQVPAWPAGLLVSFSSSGAFPPPLTSDSKFFYTPTTSPGVFNLSTKRYPVELADYVDVTSANSGLLKIKRAEIFNPGAYVKVSGTYLSKNDGNYIIRKTEPEGDKVRVYVMEKIPFSTPQDRQFDGLMEFNFDSYDAPVYCPVSQAGDLHADTFIHETIMFEYSMHLSDSVRSAFTEFTHSGFGSAPFGSDITEYGQGSSNQRAYYAITGGSNGAPTGTILPHGYDMQLFDVGGLDETIDSVIRNYGKVV